MALREPRDRPEHDKNPRAFFDALLLLHLDQPDRVPVLSTPPDEIQRRCRAIWRPWSVALWVEAAVLADAPDAAERC